jgi:molybdopterin molybdotransferase
MVSVDEALAHILQSFQPLPGERVPLHRAHGRTLTTPITASIDLPPFAASSMDGFALHAEDALSGARLPVVMDILAGRYPDQALKPGEAARIMTGAPLPVGANTVIPFELTDVPRLDSQVPAWVTLQQQARPGDNIRPIGEDVRSGETVLAAGRVLRAPDIGAAASLGITQVEVRRKPLVAILSTGDELVDPGQVPAAGQIRDANRPMLIALIEALGAEVFDLGIAADTEDAVRAAFHRAIGAGVHLILSSAGVSVGAADVVKSVIESMGALSLWKVNLRPGKPLAFGHIAGIPYMGLPGNPVSAYVTFDVFARPAILRLMGYPVGTDDATGYAEAVTAEPMSSDGRRTYMRVRLENRNGILAARTTGTQSSGALSSLVKADGLLIIPEGLTDIPIGTRLKVRLLSQ